MRVALAVDIGNDYVIFLILAPFYCHIVWIGTYQMQRTRISTENGMNSLQYLL